MQMASNEQQPSRRRSSHEWTLPAFSVFLGLVMWAAAWIGGHPMLGLAMFGIMVAFGAIAGASYLIALIWFRWRS
jgi:hypothetical protein